MGMMQDIKKDIMEDAMDAILETDKAKEMLKIADPFIKPALKNLLKELGPDDKRFMVYFDNASGLLCFLQMKTANIKQFEIEGVERGDLFTIDPNEIQKGNVKDVIKAIIQKLGVKLM